MPIEIAVAMTIARVSLWREINDAWHIHTGTSVEDIAHHLDYPPRLPG